MYDYGLAPANDEVEITVFGPGYGEAIAVHLGDENWIFVDSCISPQSKISASLEYLKKIGVPFSCVHTIIASHWHDDHVKGLTAMVEACQNATLFVSGVFNKSEAHAFLSAYGGRAVTAHTAGAKELFNAVHASKKPVEFTNHRTLIWEGTIQGRKMRAVAFSPTPAACAQSLAHMAQLLPGIRDPIKQVVELKPNLEAVVINIDLGDDAILLGSDLEDHGELGWTSIVGDQWCLRNQRASAYKISHHGSSTGDHPEIWSGLLTKNPIAVLTPFINGSVRLPGPADRDRIMKQTEFSYMSSDGSKRPQMDKNLIRRMGELANNLTPLNTGFGVVRFRKKLGTESWNVDLFGQAKRMA
jgi:beta-lactamase superfamily II metal-dependent hydrolase